MVAHIASKVFAWIRPPTLRQGLSALLAAMLTTTVARATEPVGSVGSAPLAPNRIARMDDHNFALLAWARRGDEPLPVVHIDAHSDFGRPIDPDELAKVRALVRAQRWDDLNGLLATQRPVSLSNFLWAAGRLGLVGPITWLVPSKDPIDDQALEHFRKFFAEEQFDWYPADDVGTLRREGTRLEVTLNGVELTITTLEAWTPPEGPVLLDVDLDYLMEFYSDDFSTPMIRVLGDFWKKLRSKQIRAALVTVSHSINGNYLPLKFRYLGSWLQALLEKPTLFTRPAPPEPWLIQSDAELREAALDLEGAENLYRTLLERMPSSAAVRFNLARNLFLQERFDESFSTLGEAADLEPAYTLGFLKLGDDFAKKGWHEGAKRLYEEARRRMPSDIRPTMRLGNLYFNTGRLGRAAARYRQALETDPDNVDARVYLAETLLALGETARALELYDTLAEEAPVVLDRSHPRAWKLRGDALMASGHGDGAREAYRRALSTGRLPPDDRQVVERRLAAP